MFTQSLRVMVAVSDDPARAFLVDNLAADGYDVTPATGVKHAACRLQAPVDALVVDLDADTLKLIDAVRSGAVLSVDPNLPILALSGAADSFYAIRLLERGADDVLSVPWIYIELRARLAALVRRANINQRRQLVSVGALRVDLQARRVWVAEAEIAGLLAPAVGELAERGLDFELTAGFHRFAAVQQLGHVGIDGVIRERDTDAGDADVAAARATENIARKQLNAYEEAVAVKAMLDRGLSEDGAAQALGWPRARVTARVKLLELPEKAQRMVGDGRIQLVAVDQLRAIGKVAPKLQDAVIEFVAENNEWAASRLASAARLK